MVCAKHSPTSTNAHHAICDSEYAQHVHCPIHRILSRHSCSIPCFKTHKETHSNDVQEQSQPVQTVPAPIVQESLPRSRPSNQKTDFAGFENDPDLARLMARYPGLRIQLQSVYGLTLEPSPQDRPERQQFHRGRGRGGWRGRGRGYSQQQQQQRPSQWTQAKGDKEAQESFRRMRDADGETEGMAEFVQLLKMKFGAPQDEGMT